MIFAVHRRCAARTACWGLGKANYKVAYSDFVIGFPPNPPLRGGAAAEQTITANRYNQENIIINIAVLLPSFSTFDKQYSVIDKPIIYVKNIEALLLYSSRNYKDILSKKTNFLFYLPLVLFLFFAGDLLELSIQENKILQYLGMIGINGLLAKELKKYIIHKAYKNQSSLPSFNQFKYVLTNLILYLPSITVIMYLLISN